MQRSLVLLVVTLAIAGAWPSRVSVEPKNVAEERPRVKRQQSSCINFHCRVLLNQIQSEGRYSSIQSDSQCQNGYCQDVLDVTYFDGTRSTYLCNNNGCSERGGGGTGGSMGFSNNGYSSQQSSPSWARPAGVFGSTMNQPGSAGGFGQSAYERMQAAQNSYYSTTGYDPTGSAYYRPRPQGSSYGTGTSDSACQSPYCTDLVNRIKVDGRQTGLHVDSSCVNGQCGDIVSVVYYDGTRQTYDCNSYGCSLRGKVSVPEPVTVTSRFNDQPYDISRCSTVPCRDLIQKLNSEVVYSNYNVTTSCDSSMNCIDTITILYRDNTEDVFTCDVDGCQIKGNDYEGQYPGAVTTPSPEISNSTKPTRPRPTKRRRTKPTTTTTADPTTMSDYDYYDTDSSSVPSVTEESFFINSTESTTTTTTTIRPTTTTSTTTKRPTTTTKTTTRDPTTTSTTTTSTTQMPSTSTATPTLSTKPTENEVEPCVQDSDCSGHHICFNGCIDPCEFCGKNALCDVIQKTTKCHCPDNMQGDPEVECTPSTDVEVPTTTSTSRADGCLLPSDLPNAQFCPSRCVRGCQGEGSACYLRPGTTTRLETVRVQCAQGYGLDDERRTMVPCYGGQWLDEFPKCLALCPPLKSDTMVVECRLGGREVDCGQSVKPGTHASLRCRPSHSQYEYLRSLYETGLFCGQDGRWSHAMPECKPDCGLPISYSELHPEIWEHSFNKINHGEVATLGMYPWHAGLYQRIAAPTAPTAPTAPAAAPTTPVAAPEEWEYFCGGSLVTSRVVVTAAHCIALMDHRNVQVALGKVYRSWETEEKTCVKRKVVKIEYPREFNTGLTYTWDVALLLLDKPVQISRYVMPVCHNARYTLATIYNSPAFVSGWGATHLNPSPDLLQHTNFSIIETEKCKRQVPKTLSGWDRFCGAKNTSDLSVAQKGDSGGGVTSVFDDKHYIVGVVSLNYERVSIFINVTYEYIEQWMNRQIFHFEIQSQQTPNVQEK